MAVDPKVVGGGAVVVAIGGGSGYAISQAVSSSDVKTKIKAEIGEQWLLSVETSNNTNQEEYKELLTKLRGVSDKSTIKDANLKTISEENTSVDSDWTKLKGWCSTVYESDSTVILLELAKGYCKKPSILDKLKGTELSKTETSLSSEWGTKVTNAVADTNTTNPELKNRLNAITGDSNNSQKKTSLQGWCDEQYLKPFDTDTNKLLTEVKKWCALTIKEKLESNKRFENFEATDQESGWTSLTSTLSSYSQSGSEPALTTELQAIKDLSQDTDNSQKKTKLKAWCKNAYEKGYKGDDNLWKLVNKFCTKS